MVKTMRDMPELPVIRPPNEWKSLLLRITRGCKWNRCRFCGVYPHLGEPDFSVRSVEDVKHDIDLLSKRRSHYENAFLGDADPLEVGVGGFVEITQYLRQVFSINRVTCYARASTVAKLDFDSVQRIADAGLNRVHLGLESGDEKTLQFHRKGQSPKIVRKAASLLQKAGIEISFYVLLGLGGKDNWRNHINETAKLINQIEPEFVRIRRLWLYEKDPVFESPECPLWKEIRAGSFIPQTPEGSVHELRLLIESLAALATFFACDHQNNYVHVAGLLKDDKKEMLAEVDTFLSLSNEEREAHYRDVGSNI